MFTKKMIKRLIELDKEIQTLSHIKALLLWDQETYMPQMAITERAEQVSMLEAILYDKITSMEMGELLNELVVKDERIGDSGSENEYANENNKNYDNDGNNNEINRAIIREIYRRYKRNTRLNKKLVMEIARHTCVSQSKWATARKLSDFTLFAPYLKKMLNLTREKAECLGYKNSIYDPLLDEFEPWMKTSYIKSVFSSLEGKLVSLISKIKESSRKIDNDFLKREYSEKKQHEYCLWVMKEIGYDFKKGRLDTSAHPFTTTLGIDDIRITTRYQKNFLNTGILGALHECGHALYDMGISKEYKDNNSILADGTSMGIHESQSRLWENIIGRSLAFWKYFFPRLKNSFPESLMNVSVEDFYRAVNNVKLSCIRIEADEVTYNLHIILRFKLEQKLITGELDVNDLPEAWNAESKELFGIVPEKDAHGVLQDIHWSMGAFGYFPTYCLGNIYAAQFYYFMQQDIPLLDGEIEKGNFSVILKWLRDKIHGHGRVYPAHKLCEKVTGECINPDYFINYLENKYQMIYEY